MTDAVIDLSALVPPVAASFAKVPFAGEALSRGDIWLALIIQLMDGLDHCILYAFFKGGDIDALERFARNNPKIFDGDCVLIDTGQRYPSRESALEHAMLLRKHNKSANIWPDVYEFLP